MAAGMEHNAGLTESESPIVFQVRTSLGKDEVSELIR